MCQLRGVDGIKEVVHEEYQLHYYNEYAYFLIEQVIVMAMVVLFFGTR